MGLKGSRKHELGNNSKAQVGLVGNPGWGQWDYGGGRFEVEDGDVKFAMGHNWTTTNA